MDVQTQSMPCSVEKSLHAAMLKSRRKSFAREIVHYSVVNIVRASPILYFAESDFLSTRDAMIGVL